MGHKILLRSRGRIYPQAAVHNIGLRAKAMFIDRKVRRSGATSLRPGSLYLFVLGVFVRDVPQRLKPEGFIELYRRSKDLLHPVVGYSKDLLHPAWDTVKPKKN
jgi:hypothetical protein